MFLSRDNDLLHGYGVVKSEANWSMSSFVICGIQTMWAICWSGASDHFSMSALSGRGKTTRGEFSLRQARTLRLLSCSTAYWASSIDFCEMSLSPLMPCLRRAYQRMRGAKLLLDPAMVVSCTPTYSTDRAMRLTWDFFAMVMPHGTGAPSILWPEMERLSMPAAKSQAGGLSSTVREMPCSAASECM